MPDINQLIADSRLPEKTMRLCLRGDLVADHEQLVRETAKAKPAADSLAGPAATDTDTRLEQLREQMRDATITIRMRALPRRRWQQLMDSHPAAAADNEQQPTYGYDPEAFFAAVIPESIVEPQLTAEQWTKLADVLTESQYGELADLVNALNIRKVDIPN